jgi:VIT1/CCC1 family predicted Fe2+/Mn2+ transporter
LIHYYQILELPYNSTAEEIKRAYRRLARKFHPDVSTLPNAREKFIELTEAYEYLINKLKFEEDKKKAASEPFDNDAQSTIDAWLIQERERIRARARKHANMKYRNFRGTKEYKATNYGINFFSIFTFIIGTVIVFTAIFGTYIQYQINPLQMSPSYIISAIIIGIMGVAITSFSGYRLWKLFKGIILNNIFKHILKKLLRHES